jgi:uncharacterized protein YeeX (DUF496 family)
MDKKDLKIQALREGFRDRVAFITEDYENRIADLRIELTEVSQERDALRAAQAEQERLVQEEAAGTPKVSAEDSNDPN